MSVRTIFVTGTDTGVGKTLLTSLLLCHLRTRGVAALALKPFCSGSRDDAQLLCRLQEGDLTLDEINPFYFPEPVAPLVSARKHKRFIPLDQVVHHIHSIAARVAKVSYPASAGRTQNQRLKTQNYLLIEGSGGLLVPLGKGYTVLDLITHLNCEVIVVSRNKLGTLNHTLLTVQALNNRTPRSPNFSLQPSAFSLSRLVLMDSARPDASCRSNPGLLRELLAPTPLIPLPHLGLRASSPTAIRKNADRFKRVLSQILGLQPLAFSP